MAASVALKSFTIKSDEYNNEYDVEILDMQGVYSSAFRFNIGTDFSLNYNSQSDERFSPIKGSDLSLPIIIQNANQENIILTQMLNSVSFGEDRWLVKVNKNGDLFWVGVVVFDLWQKSCAAHILHSYHVGFVLSGSGIRSAWVILWPRSTNF
jgi:ABC-type antimicrobial peptide transport system permease subunit